MSWLWNMVHSFDDLILFICILALPVVLCMIIILALYEYYRKEKWNRTLDKASKGYTWLERDFARKNRPPKRRPLSSYLKSMLPSFHMSRETETILNRFVGWFFNQL